MNNILSILFKVLCIRGLFGGILSFYIRKLSKWSWQSQLKAGLGLDVPGLALSTGDLLWLYWHSMFLQYTEFRKTLLNNCGLEKNF